MLDEKFGKRKIYKDLNADEVVAIGATLYANKDGFRFKVSDVIPHSIFTDVWENNNRLYQELIKKNTPIPLVNPPSLMLGTYYDHQEIMDMTLYEGDDKNELISKPFHLDANDHSNIAGLYRVKCTFSVDENGLLKLTAHDLQKDNKLDLEFNLSTKSY